LTFKKPTASLIMSTDIDCDSKKEDVNVYTEDGVVEPVLLEDAAPVAPQYAVKRVMTTRQIQFYAIGGTIGTAVFVSVSIELDYCRIRYIETYFCTITEVDRSQPS
jgi:amino acid permease